MDISDTLAPKSDQLDNIELADGPRIFTVASVSKNNGDQPINVHLVEFPRPWRPGKNMRRVLAFCWGKEASEWAGRRVELFRDETVTFGKDKPGGTRISRLSHIDGPKSVPLIVSQGRTANYPVEPLPDLTVAERIAALGNEWRTADPERRKVIEADVAALKQEAQS